MPYDLTNAFPALVTAQGITIGQDLVSALSNAFPALGTCASFNVNVRGSEVGYSTMFPSLAVFSGSACYFSLAADAAGAPLPAFLDQLTSIDSLDVIATNLDARGGMPTFPLLTTATGNFSMYNSSVAAAYGGQPWAGAFPALNALGGSVTMSIAGLTSLTNFMPLVASAVSVSITGMSAIFTGIAGLTSMAGSFVNLGALSGSLNLSTLDVPNFNVFQALTTVTGNIQIYNNVFLTNVLTGLSNVNGLGVTGLTVVDNTSLPTTAQVQALRNNYVAEGFAGTFTNVNNGPG